MSHYLLPDNALIRKESLGVHFSYAEEERLPVARWMRLTNAARGIRCPDPAIRLPRRGWSRVLLVSGPRHLEMRVACPPLYATRRHVRARKLKAWNERIVIYFSSHVDLKLENRFGLILARAFRSLWIYSVRGLIRKRLQTVVLIEFNLYIYIFLNLDLNLCYYTYLESCAICSLN